MAGTAVEILDNQHQRIAGLFADVSSPQADRPSVLKELLQELSAHVSVERSILYPVVRSHEIGGDRLVDDLEADYKEIEKLLIHIERRKVNSPDMPQLVTELKDATEAHISRTVSDLFPAMDAGLTDEQQAELAKKMSSADEVIVTHPHPHLNSLGPLSRLTTRLAARFDRARDRTVDNRHGD